MHDGCIADPSNNCRRIVALHDGHDGLSVFAPLRGSRRKSISALGSRSCVSIDHPIPSGERFLLQRRNIWLTGTFNVLGITVISGSACQAFFGRQPAQGNGGDMSLSLAPNVRRGPHGYTLLVARKARRLYTGTIHGDGAACGGLLICAWLAGCSWLVAASCTHRWRARCPFLCKTFIGLSCLFFFHVSVYLSSNQRGRASSAAVSSARVDLWCDVWTEMDASSGLGEKCIGA